jgi:hypothetical protein
MMRTVKFVLDTIVFCLKMIAIHVGEAWDLMSYSENDRAGNPEKRVNAT